MSVWATTLKGIIKLNKKEKSIMPNAQIVYARPPTIQTMITNYKTLSKENDKQTTVGSKKCGRCGLCGNHGRLKNMVEECGDIETKDGHRIKIKQSVNCKDSGIYVARCLICKEMYVGQSSQKFSERWNGHRAAWRELIAKGRVKCRDGIEYNDGCALFLHYMRYHQELVWGQKNQGIMELSDGYEVVFVEKAADTRLDTSESFWITRLNSSININKTFLPKIK